MKNTVQILEFVGPTCTCIVGDYLFIYLFDGVFAKVGKVGFLSSVRLATISRIKSIILC